MIIPLTTFLKKNPVEPFSASTTTSLLDFTKSKSQPSAFDIFKQFPAGLSEASNQIVSSAIGGEKAAVTSALNTKPGLALTDFLSKRISPTPTKIETAFNQTLFTDKTPTITDYGKTILPKFAQKGPLPFIAGLGLTALDFTGAGGEKSVIKSLTTLTKETEVAKVLRQINVGEDVIKEYAPILAKTTKEADVANIITHIEDIQKTTKVAKLTESAKKERGYITSIKEQLPNLKVTGQYIPRSTDELSIKAANLVKEDLSTAEKIALGIDDKAVATASELLKYYSEEISKASPIVRNALEDKAAMLANTAARNLTESGRSVQAASILGRLTPEGQVRFAAREIQRYNDIVEKNRGGILGLQKKIPELTGEQTRQIVDEMKAIGKMPDGQEKSVRFQRLQNYISDLVPSSIIKKLTAVWKAGLLTGVKTTGVNIFSNVSHFGSEIAKDIPAKMIDNVASLFTGEKTIGGTTKDTLKGLKQGFQKGLTYLKTGYDERNLATKLDYNRVNFGKSKIGQAVKAYTDTIFHLLGAEDQPFYYGALTRSIADQAKAQSLTKGLKGKEAKDLIGSLIQNPTEKMLKYAVKDAETAVFQNKTALGNIAKQIQQLPLGEIIVPFGRTPSAVAMQIINYSPLGIIKTLWENIGKGRFDQRLFSQGLGRALTGTGVLSLGAELFKNKLMTLDRPTGEREQKLWELEGRKPNSIKIGDKWRSIQVLGPLGNVLLVGGHFKQAFQNSGSPTEAIGQALAGALKSFTEQTFLTGINQVVSAINDPQKSAGSFVANTTASGVPTLLSDVARATDKKERRTGTTLLDKLKARIPGLRETLEPQINVLGKDINTLGNPLEVIADPTRPQNVIFTPVIHELRRLTDAGFFVSPTLLGDKNGYKGLNAGQNSNLWRRAGEITNSKLANLFGKTAYETLKDDQKAKAVEDVISKSQINARAETVLNLIKDLKGDELKNKLSELKKSGLMSRDVYNQVARMR